MPECADIGDGADDLRLPVQRNCEPVAGPGKERYIPGEGSEQTQTVVVNGVDIASVPLAELRELRQTMIKLENQVSYWRRIIQARLDLVRDGSLKRSASIEGLQRILSQQLGNNNRKVLMDVQSGFGDIPNVAGLGSLWNRMDDDLDNDSNLVEQLVVAERELSKRRNELHDGIDAATAELVSRYRANPELVLTALPSRSSRPQPL